MPSLEELKATRKELQMLFAVLMQGSWKGEAVEAVASAKKFIDNMYLGVQNDIEAQEKTFTENLKETIADANITNESDKPAEPTAA